MNMPEPMTEEAVDFLVRYRGSEPIVLTAIVPDGGPVESETFRPAEEQDRLRKWLDARQGASNLYFTVNPTMKPMSGRVKAAKEHIKGMTTLHVDIDPRAGEDLERERERALRLLRTFSPPPTIIIDSGGGFQGFWVLDRLHETNGDLDRSAELERYNQQLAVLLQADACHNIDRIMRLPGTINVPDAKKLKKGRTARTARLVEFNDNAYSLSYFTPAMTVDRRPKVPARRTNDRPAPAAPLGEERLRSLPSTVSDAVKDLLRHGFDPEKPDRFPSRSEAVMSAACALYSARCDREVIVEVLLDPSLGISAHVLDQPKPGNYAARQADRAAAFVESRPFRALTDMGNAQLLVDIHGDDILHCYPQKTWLVWDGRRWVRDDGYRIDKRVKDVPLYLREEAARVRASGDEKLAERIAAWAHKSQSRERLRATADVARSEVPVDPADLDVNATLLNVANGTLDLTTGELRAFNRDDLITKQVAVEFDPNATAPTFMAFLARIMGYPAADEAEVVNPAELRQRKRSALRLLAFLQRAVGYSLTGRTNEQVFFVAHGTGQNGKSTFLEIIRAVLGDYARSTDTETFAANDRRDASGPTEHIARLHGARLVTAGESSEGQQLDEKLIKQITGGDKMAARHLYQASFEFTPTFKVWIAANCLPEIRGQDPAIWRRPKAIPFTVTIPKDERDPRLKDRIILEELPGVLAWAVRGAQKWLRRGLRPPREVESFTEHYRGEMDIIGDFIKARCRVAPDVASTTKTLLAAYNNWCEENGEQPIKPRTFGRRLKEHGFVSQPMWDHESQRTVRNYVGIRPLTDSEFQEGYQHELDVSAAHYEASFDARKAWRGELSRPTHAALS